MQLNKKPYQNAPDYPKYGCRDVRDIEVSYEVVTGKEE